MAVSQLYYPLILYICRDSYSLFVLPTVLQKCLLAYWNYFPLSILKAIAAAVPYYK